MIQVSIAKHGVAFPAKVLASNGGKHIFNITLNETQVDFVDNGSFVGKGAFQELDRYLEAAPTSVSATVVGKAANGNFYVEITSAENAYLVYQVPMIEETYSNKFTIESNFTNGAKDTVRAYELAAGDIIEMSAEAFKGTVAVNDAVTLQAVTNATYKKLGK